MPLVSIITPSWNVERFIEETIDSVQAQSFGDWELLIADDCSTDKTPEIIAAIGARDPRVKLIRQPTNGGPALARQAAIDQAQGRYLAFLDSYDRLLKNTSIATLTALVDREISGPVAMTNEGYDDFCLWLSILRRGHIAHGFNEDLARYRVRGSSVSSRPGRSAKWVWNIYRNVEQLPLLKSVWCFSHWGARAWLKRQQF